VSARILLSSFPSFLPPSQGSSRRGRGGSRTATRKSVRHAGKNARPRERASAAGDRGGKEGRGGRIDRSRFVGSVHITNAVIERHFIALSPAISELSAACEERKAAARVHACAESLASKPPSHAPSRLNSADHYIALNAPRVASRTETEDLAVPLPFLDRDNESRMSGTSARTKREIDRTTTSRAS